uniref:Uncharacterized protein n=1 Tax=Setaria viridis TaxID=4556 RepID=A0A4V6D0M6_SETVI|nr:hypothetical protein SEVIR_9G092866v2 [Setaria viridis]
MHLIMTIVLVSYCHLLQVTGYCGRTAQINLTKMH